MRRETKLLLAKGVDSLILSVEHFNRPSNLGRVSAVLILLDHAFEMLLKAAIVHRGVAIRNANAPHTIGFEECIRQAISNAKLKFLTQETAFILRAINSLRDATQHHIVEVSEQQLYLQVQAGVTLFRSLFRDVFGKELGLELPDRVLPISTTPPTDLLTLFDNEVEEIKKLLQPGSRRHLEAIARLRGLAIIEGASQENSLLPTDQQLNRLGKSILEGKHWGTLFPGVAAINLVATGYGPSINLRITKNEGLAVHLVREGTAEAPTVAAKRISELDYYNLSHTNLAKKLDISQPMLTALVRYMKLENDPECCHVFHIGSSVFKRFAPKAIDVIKSALAGGQMDDAWQAYQAKNRAEYQRRQNR